MERELSSNQEGIEKQEQMYVMILQLSNGRYYTEAVNDVRSRMKEHGDKKHLHTRGYLPVKLVFFISMKGEQQAEALVVRIRKVGVKFWFEGLRDHELTYEY